MRTNFYIGLSIIVLVILFGAFGIQQPKIVTLEYPESWPSPSYNFEKNPLTDEGIYLGRKLFYDPILSRDSSISCSSCHLSYTAFTHVDHSLSHGIDDRTGRRNSMTLVNMAWSSSFMWDGAVNHLDMQALATISDHTEMDHDIRSVVLRLSNSKEYIELFDAAFGDTLIIGEHVLKALSQFQLTFVSANSRYDQVMKYDSLKFTPQEERGYAIFKEHCESCHKEPLFTTGLFANNGLPIDTTLNDLGRMGITNDSSDYLLFKIPSLRNVEFSFPYMHDGRFDKLSEVIKHYNKGISKSHTLANSLQNLAEFSIEERIDLEAFLLTLTDKEFLFNPAYSFPRSI